MFIIFIFLTILVFFIFELTFLSGMCVVIGDTDYFLLKINDCNKYNLDIENVLLEFNGKLLIFIESILNK